jgi:hypothetical protein
MIILDEIKMVDKEVEKEALHVSRSQKKITCSLILLKYRDKHTLQFCYYIPSLEVSGYGATTSKAMEMLVDSLNDCFKFLMRKDQKALKADLIDLGWRLVELTGEQYSRKYIRAIDDVELYNAIEDQVERINLVA